MIRYDCFEWLAPLLTDQLVVTSLSGQRVEWGHLSKRDADLNLGSMGNALAVGIGLALALPRRKVLVFESDGSVLLSLFNLPTLANLNPHNLAVFVFDNQAYSGTRISYPSALNQAGLRFVVCKIEESLGHRKLTRSNVDLLETKYRFVRYLERTEGKAIFQGRG